MKNISGYAKVDEEKVYPHNFRHLFAVSFYKETKDIVYLSDLLGHSNVNTTRIYTRTTLNDFKEKLEGLNLAV